MQGIRLVRARGDIKKGDLCYTYRAGGKWWLASEHSNAYERIAKHDIKMNESVPFHHYHDTEALELPTSQPPESNRV